MKKLEALIIVIIIAMVAMPSFTQADSKQSSQTSKVSKVDYMDPKFFSPIFNGEKIPGWTGVAIDSSGCLWVFADSTDSTGRIVANKDKDHVHVLIKLPRKCKKVVFVFRGIGGYNTDAGVFPCPAGIIIRNGSDKYIELTPGHRNQENAATISFLQKTLVNKEVSVQTFFRPNSPEWWKKEKEKPDYIIRFQ